MKPYFSRRKNSCQIIFLINTVKSAGFLLISGLDLTSGGDVIMGERDGAQRHDMSCIMYSVTLRGVPLRFTPAAWAPPVATSTENRSLKGRII